MTRLYLYAAYHFHASMAWLLARTIGRWMQWHQRRADAIAVKLASGK
jgi:hypothetical protein